MKICNKCKLEKSEKAFDYLDARRTHRKITCRKCREKRWEELNPQRKKNKDRKKLLRLKYNLTPEDYDNLLIKQNYTCAICKQPKKKENKELCVDHCHKTNKIRGLLCDDCNISIGILKENIQTLENAILYLKEYNQK